MENLYKGISYNYSSQDEMFRVHTMSNWKAIKLFSSLTEDEAKNAIANYTKFVFVRNPLERLVSTWHDKFGPNGMYSDPKYVRFSRDIRKFGKNISEKELNQVGPASLEEFFRYLIANRREIENFNIHWRPMAYFCGFCRIQYDFIGELDNLGCEMDFIVRHSPSLTNIIKIPEYSHPYKKTNKNEELLKVPHELLKTIVEMYQVDFEMFGYQIPEF